MYEIVVGASEVVHGVCQVLANVDLAVRVGDPIYGRHSSQATATEPGGPLFVSATSLQSVPMFSLGPLVGRT